MIRQMCGRCGAVNQVPEGAAGTSVPCSKCGAALDVPAAYLPAVAADGGVPPAPDAPKPLPPLPPPPVAAAAPAPPPGLNLAAFAPKPVADPTAPAAPPPGDGHGFRVSLNPLWLDWVPVAAVTAALVCTFFFWVGSYPGGVRVYGQGPWYALVGDIDAVALPDVTGDEKEIEANLHGNRWLIAYLPLLIAAVGLFWLERAFRNPTIASVPGPLAWLPGIWPQRFPLFTGLAVALLLLLAAQTWRGYGLEHAVRTKVNAQFAEAEAKADTTPARQTVAVNKGRELARYQLHNTTALDAALLLHVVAALGTAGRWWLHRRGGKPHPAVEFRA